MGEPWEGTLDGEDALEKRQEADKEASGAAPGASWPEPGHLSGPAGPEPLGPGHTHHGESPGSTLPTSVPYYDLGPVPVK